LSERHLSAEIIKNASIENHKFGSFYCKEKIECGMHSSLQFINLDLDKYCVEQDVEVCVIRLNNCFANLCVLSIYRSPSGNFDTFLTKLEELLNNLIQNQNNVIICEYFINNSTNKSRITSLLALYNLDYIVDFPTRKSIQSASIDYIFLDKSHIKNYSIGLFINGLSYHDTLMLSFSLSSHNLSNCGKAKIGRIYGNSSIKEFIMNLSYESWENVFNSDSDNDVNSIFNNFLNTY
jgi:hypothetical protein